MTTMEAEAMMNGGKIKKVEGKNDEYTDMKIEYNADP